MTKVVALAKGFYLQVRDKGDVFRVPFTDEQIEKCSWLAPFGTPVPKERTTPTGRMASMKQVIQGIPPEDAEDEPDTMSEMTQDHARYQKAHPRAHGIPTEEPAAEPKAYKKKVKKPRRTRSDKGVPRPNRRKTAEVTP